jgi:hypothetical protein
MTRKYMSRSHLRLPQSGGPGPRIYITQEQVAGTPTPRAIILPAVSLSVSEEPKLPECSDSYFP